MVCSSTGVCPMSSLSQTKMSWYCSSNCVSWHCWTGDKWFSTNPPSDMGALLIVALSGSTTDAASTVPTQCPACNAMGSDRNLWTVIHTAGPLAKIGEEDRQRGRSRLGSKQMVWWGQGFDSCTKQTDLGAPAPPATVQPEPPQCRPRWKRW